MPINLLNELTTQQQKAVKHFKGPLLITAGPGAGKTRVIVHRVAYLIDEYHIAPENILVTTFTNKAADELKDRLSQLIGTDIETMQVSTIHSFCQTLLEQYPEKHEYGRTFDILDDEAQFIFIDSNLFQLGLKKYLKSGVRKRCPRNRGKFIAELVNTFNKCTEHYVNPDDFIKYVEENCTEEKGYEEYLAIARAYRYYLKLLRKQGLIDFSGLQREALELLNNHSDVLEKVRNQYRFILVDEYQDTNPIQDEIFWLIAQPNNNICVVGDDDQSIYRFRGATVKNFQEFADRYPDTEIIDLEKNFRSTEEIVHITKELIQHNDKRMEKYLVPVRGKGNKVALIHEETDEGEAETASNLIKQMREKKVIKHYGDVAILFKSVKYHAKKYLDALDEEGIPYVVIGDGSFFDRPEIQNLLYLLNFVGREGWKEKEFPFQRRNDWWTIDILEGEVLDFHPSTIEALEALPREKSLTDFKTVGDLEKIGVKKEEDRHRLVRLLKVRTEFKEKKVGILNLFYKILEASGYLERLLKQQNDEAEEILHNLGKFSSLIRKFERHGRWNDIGGFFWYINNLPERSIDAIKVEREEAVKIMTIHQAKGLEFPFVIVGSVVEGRFPNIRDDEDSYPVPEKLFLRKLETHDGVNITDQRRMFYVGLARAQDNLVIGTANKVGTRYRKPSRFIIDDIKRENLVSPDLLTAQYKSTTRESEARERMSYSALNVYLSCPLCYKLLYIYNFETPAWYFQNYGKSIHLALENIHRDAKEGKEITNDLIENILAENWVPFRYGDKEREENMKQRALKLLTRYVKNYEHRLKRIRDVEKRFNYPIGEYVLTGLIDLLTEEDGIVEIIDFKTRSVSGFKLRDAKFQLNFYALPISDEEKIKHLTSHLLEDNKVNHFPWDNNIKKTTENKIRETCENIAAENFEPRKNYLCRECEFKFACPT